MINQWMEWGTLGPKFRQTCPDSEFQICGSPTVWDPRIMSSLVILTQETYQNVPQSFPILINPQSPKHLFLNLNMFFILFYPFLYLHFWGSDLTSSSITAGLEDVQFSAKKSLGVGGKAVSWKLGVQNLQT